MYVKFTDIFSENLIKTDILDDVSYDIFDSSSIIAGWDSCNWPCIIFDQNIISGLCSVVRFIVKQSNNPKIRQLLGFRDACLVACSESSIWTRFCEIDMPNTVNYLLNKSLSISCIPPDILRFEYHLNQPVRIHNVYKIAREQNKDNSIKSSTPLKDLNLTHKYGEGPFMTLADATLFPSFHVIFTLIGDKIKAIIPKSIIWYEGLLKELPNISISVPHFSLPKIELRESNFIRQSLYTADPNRYRPEKRIFTKQSDIETAFERSKFVTIKNDLPFGIETEFNWNDIPRIINPIGGALPATRADRKCQQLENLVKAVLKVVDIVNFDKSGLNNKKSFKIVDFCSGSGHLGILLAFILPNHHIILVENKEKSLERARERIEHISLKNVTIIQSNLDYFTGNFDIGVSLHACGVATDLVIEKCIKNHAHFISCPCCYGGIKDCHQITYPRSAIYKCHLPVENYLNLAHAADQTHETDNKKTKQGYECMDLIDWDRKLYAEGQGYNVFLGKLQPMSCTNKNNLLVGICKKYLN